MNYQTESTKDSRTNETSNQMSSIYEVQPEWCRAPLPKKDNYFWYGKGWETDEYKQQVIRVLEFDPTPVYNRIHSLCNPFARYYGIGITTMFPYTTPGYCACGCGTPLTGRQRKWAEGHSMAATDIAWIIAGQTEVIIRYLHHYYGKIGCMECDSTHFHLDHKWPIKHGGGNAWLSNYQFLCHKCHREKTKRDFGWGQQQTNQMKLL
jgi:hypothetical protein